MNRIQHLAYISGLYSQGTPDSWDTEALQKFGDLLIRECIELTLDYKNDQYYQGWLDYRDLIKEHFGVKA